MEQPRARRATWRMGARERGRLQALAIAIICSLLFLAFRPYFQNLAETRDLQVCETNMRKIAKGLQLYSADWDGSFPEAATWMNSIEQYVEPTSGTGFARSVYFICPKDQSGSVTSYAYNSALAGLNSEVRGKDPATEARRARFRQPTRAPLVFEKHGSAVNAHVELFEYDSLLHQMTLPHKMPAPTGVIITGSDSVERRNEEQLRANAGKRF